MMRKLIIALTIVLNTCFCFAQQFDPFEGKSDSFHVNMGLFFEDPAKELSSRQLLKDSIRLFVQQDNWSVQNLRSKLDNYESLYGRMQRHRRYFSLLAEKNRKDTAVRNALEETGNQLNTLDGTIDSILQLPVFAHLTDAEIAANNLSFYRYLLFQESVQAAHKLNPSAENLASSLAGRMLTRLTDRYDDMIDTIKAGQVTIKGKTYNVQTDKAKMLQSADPETRRSAALLQLKAYDRHSELFAAILIDITQEKNALAIAHKYPDAPAQYYSSRLQLSEDMVKQVLQHVAANGQVLKDYQSLEQQIVGKSGYSDTVHSWDLGLISAYHWHPLTFKEVYTLINDALVPLGKEYQVHLARLLDPQNGLLDIAYTPNRASGGNSFGHAGTPIGLFMQNFDGGFHNTSTLIHEGGHAIHRQLMSENKVIPSYFSGQNFISEAYAMLNELLLLDELEKRAKTRSEKAYFTRLFIDKLSHEIFTSAEEGAFEQGLYDGVSKGNINGLEDINSLYSGIMKQNDLFYANEPERKTEWIAKDLVYDDPLYNVNYLFAMLVTCKLYQLHISNPQNFAQNYTALLRSGFNQPVKELLKQHMGFDLNYNKLLNEALELMRNKITELKQLTK